MIVLVPAYEPDHRLVTLVRQLAIELPTYEVVVVDDGSGESYTSVFDALENLGARVLTHDVNQGKGAALKTGFAYAHRVHPDSDVVCADCDGQHTPADIHRVAHALCSHRDGPVLGVRDFSGDVPLRSRFGNATTRVVYRLATGLRLTDTQTGLRGYPAHFLSWLGTVRGDRFEYELEALLAGQRSGQSILQVPIETIYIEENQSSHFRPIIDSARVYWPLLRFAASSLSAFVVDFVAFILLASTTSLAVAVIGARAFSAGVNYLLNHYAVFRSDVTTSRSAPRYMLLALVILVANYLLLRTLVVQLGVPVVPAKLMTEAALMLVSFRLQQQHVFASPRTTANRDQREREAARAAS